MSVEDFFRGLREDLVDSTRKMMEEITILDGEAKVKNKKVDTVNKDDQGKGSGSVAKVKVPADAVEKIKMEFVQLAIENKSIEQGEGNASNPDTKTVDAEVDAPPPGKPPVMTKKEEKKSKKDKKQKELKVNNIKHKEVEKKEAKRREAKQKVPKRERSTGAPDEDLDKLKYLTDMIMNIKDQIDEIKEGYDYQEAKPVIDHGESQKCPSVSSAKVKDKAATKQPKSKFTQSESGATKKEYKRKVKKDEIAYKRAQQMPNSSGESTDTEELPSDQKLLLKLFTLSSSQRTKYIEIRGVELGLLDPHPFKKHVVLVNQRVQHLAETLFADAKGYITASKTNGDKSGTVKQEHETFEEQVKYLLDNAEHVEEYNPELTMVGVRDDAQNILQDRLQGFVDQLIKNKVGYIVEGCLRINARNNVQSFVDDISQEKNVCINSIVLRRCAMDGDLVRVFVTNKQVTVPPANGEAEKGQGCLDSTLDSINDNAVEENTAPRQNNVGFVVAILEKRHNRRCVGKFLSAAAGKKHYRTFMPRDTRIPPLRIFKQDWPNALIESKCPDQKQGDDAKQGTVADSTDITSVLYQAEIIEWQDDVPIGAILKSIGKCGVLEAENESILVEYSLDVTPYGADILAQLPSVPYSIPEDEVARREDLRGECIFTIDPATARDLDDALSCKLLKNGNFKVGVHISDVTYFLRESSDLDELVKLRATSIYMVDAVYHMLPKQLCNTCSLLPGQDKLAFSVFWEIQPDGTVLSTRFARSVINSCVQLSYEHAQMMLDSSKGKELDEAQFPDIMHGYTVGSLGVIVNQLQSIAVKLRQQRMNDGCLKINQPKLTFRLDPATGRPVEYGVYELRSSNEMIEDFMLLANTSVAHAIYGGFPSTSLLRGHKPPAEKMMKVLVQKLASHGHTFSFASSKAIRESMEAIVKGAEYPDAASSVLNVLLSKPMTRALYYCSAFASDPQQFKHYALAIPMYTHFTSPIRRYADCLVHRALAALLKIDEVPKRTPNELQQLATICNEKKYNAKLAGDASSMLYYRNWLGTVKEHETVAAVLDLKPHYIELVLIHSGIMVKLSTKKICAVASVIFQRTEPAGTYRLIPKNALIEPVTLAMFSKVRVTIKLIHAAITVCSILPMTLGQSITAT